MTADGPGRKGMMETMKTEIMHFNNGPYSEFHFGGSNSSFASLSNIITSFYFENFTLENKGTSDSSYATGLYVIYQNFAQSNGHNAERVWGIIRADMDALVGNLMIKTPKTGEKSVSCKVFGVARQHRPEFSKSMTGTASIFIIFEDVIVKKPFKYVENIVWSEANWPIAMHYNYHIDPACAVGFTNKERYLVENSMDGILIESMRKLTIKRYREMYVKNYIEPYMKYLESKNW